MNLRRTTALVCLATFLAGCGAKANRDADTVRSPSAASDTDVAVAVTNNSRAIKPSGSDASSVTLDESDSAAFDDSGRDVVVPTTNELMRAVLATDIEPHWRDGMELAFEALADPDDVVTVALASLFTTEPRTTEFESYIQWLRTEPAHGVLKPGPEPRFYFGSEPEPTDDEDEVTVLGCIDASLLIVRDGVVPEMTDFEESGPTPVKVRLRLEDLHWKVAEQVALDDARAAQACSAESPADSIGP